MIKRLLLLILSLLSIYFGIAFITLKMNPLEWEEGFRVALVLPYIAVISVYSIAEYENS